MTSVFDHEVSIDEQGVRLDAFVAGLGIDELASRSAAVRLIESGRILVNGQPTTKKRIVIAGDMVHIEIPPRSGENAGLEAAYDIPLDIRYEDEHLIVLSKQPGLVCHPARGHYGDTLVNALVAHCGIGNLAQVQGEDRPASCIASIATRAVLCSPPRPIWLPHACKMASARATSIVVTSRSCMATWVMTPA